MKASVGMITLLAALGLQAVPAGSLNFATCLGRVPTIVADPSRLQIKGTATADVIVATGGAHKIDGRGGNDRICAGRGDDRIVGGSGNDLIAAGPGDDHLEGGNGSDDLFAGAGADVVLGNRGNDRIDAGDGSGDFADGGLGDDLVSGGPGSHDRVIGGVGNDWLSGGAGAGDVLRGDHGADHFDGGAGNHDVASFVVSGFGGPIQGGQGVVVDLEAGQASQDGADRLTGIEDVIGTAFSDSLRGNAAGNILYGGGGDDRLLGVGAGDRAVGGTGSDVCAGVDQSETCGPEASPATLVLEAAVVGGSTRGSLTVVSRGPPFVPGGPILSQRDITVEVGFEDQEWIVVGGPRLIPGEGCTARNADIRCPVAGEPDAVLLSGASGDDRLMVNGSVPPSATAILQGDAGSDFLRGGRGDDSLNGGAKHSGSSTDVLNGGGGDDALANGRVLMGGGGSDLLVASPCTGQRVEGGAGVDSVSFARAYLGLGVQMRLGGSAVFPAHRFGGKPVPAGCSLLESEPTLIGDTTENVEGSPKQDVLIGDRAANILLGRGGHDRILGRRGDDFLVGGTGRDELTGGPGSDRLYARDAERDLRIRCGPTLERRDVAKVDPADPPAAGCRTLP